MAQAANVRRTTETCHSKLLVQGRKLTVRSQPRAASTHPRGLPSRASRRACRGKTSRWAQAASCSPCPCGGPGARVERQRAILIGLQALALGPERVAIQLVGMEEVRLVVERQ